jgi:hypothetical protein
MTNDEFEELDKKLQQAQAAQAAKAEQKANKPTQQQRRRPNTEERRSGFDHHQAEEDTHDKQARTQSDRASSQEEELYTRRRQAEPNRGRGRSWLKAALWMTAGAAALLLAVGSVLLVKKATASPEEAPRRVVETRMTFSDFIFAQEPPEPELEQLPERPRTVAQADNRRGANKSTSFLRDLSHLIFGD